MTKIAILPDDTKTVAECPKCRGRFVFMVVNDEGRMDYNSIQALTCPNCGIELLKEQFRIEQVTTKLLSVGTVQ